MKTQKTENKRGRRLNESYFRLIENKRRYFMINARTCIFKIFWFSTLNKFQPIESVRLNSSFYDLTIERKLHINKM